MSKLGIQDVTVRDGNQSILATRMQRKDIIALARALDKVGFYSLEVWGGATFDSAYRFLKQSAWNNLREVRNAAPNTKLSMLLRGQNIVGYHHYDNDTLERFIRLTIENGIDILRIFDALNDPDNLRNAFKFTKKHGGEVQAAIAYTVSPVHSNEYYVNLVNDIRKYGEQIQFASKIHPLNQRSPGHRPGHGQASLRFFNILPGCSRLTCWPW